VKLSSSESSPWFDGEASQVARVYIDGDAPMCVFADEEGGVIHELVDDLGTIAVRHGQVRIELPASVRLKVALKQALAAKNKDQGENNNG